MLGSINNDQLVAEPDVWLQPRPERTTRRTADGSRTAQIASHGRLTACRSRLVRYPDQADDPRASLFLRRGALCILACVVLGILCSLCRFPYCSVRHTSTTLHLRTAHHSIRYTLRRKGERMCFGARIVELCGQMVHGVDIRGEAGFRCTSPKIARQHIAGGPWIESRDYMDSYNTENHAITSHCRHSDVTL